MVNVSERRCFASTRSATALGDGEALEFVDRGEMDIKGKGTMKTYFMGKVFIS